MNKSILISALTLVSTTMVHASGSLGDASTFNAFIQNNYVTKSSSDVEGAIAVGGSILNSSGGAADIGGLTNDSVYGTLGSTTGISLYSGSSKTNLTGDLKGGTLYMSGSFSGSYNGATINNDPTTLAGLTSTFNNDWSYLTAVSSALTSLNGYSFNLNYTDQNNTEFDYTANSTNYQVDLGTYNNLTINLGKFVPNYTINGQNIYVIDMSAGELSTLNSKGSNIQWEGLGPTSSVIVNVDGGNGDIDWDTKLQNGENNYVLYNFTDANTITTNDKFTGSILAVDSSVIQNGGELEGNVIAENLTTKYELHYGTGSGVYQGWVPTITPSVVPAAVAAPGPAPFAAFGLGVLVLFRRRKKA